MTDTTISHTDSSALTAPVDWVERAAVGASLACLFHCLALPMVLAAIPVLTRWIAVPESFHLWAIAFAVPASGFALIAGWRRHRLAYPLAIGCAGLAGLVVGALVFPETPLETVFTVAGGLLLANAHFVNWKLRHANCVG